LVMGNSKFETQNSKPIRSPNSTVDVTAQGPRSSSFGNDSNFEFRISSLGGLITFLISVGAFAQSPSIPPQQDPLMSLMLSQPRIEITTNVMASAHFDPPVVAPGEQSIYRVSFNALEQTIDWPRKITAPSELQLEPGAHGQIIPMLGNVQMPFTTFNTRVRASAVGDFTIPEFKVQAFGSEVTVPAAQLKVVSSPPSTPSPVLRLAVEFAETNLYVGQPIRARAMLPGSAGVFSQGLPPVQFTGQGILVDQAASSQMVTITSHDGVNMPSYNFQTVITPVEAGALSVFAQCFTGNRITGSLVIPGPSMIPAPPTPFTLLESDPVTLKVRPLPKEGELPGFTGGIGSFSLDPPKLATNELVVGEPVKLAVAVRGDGNVARVVPPPPPRLRDWQILDSTPAGGITQMTPTGTVSIFQYTLVPLTDDIRATPPIPFSYFDPGRGNYVDLTIPALPVTVNAGQIPTDFATLIKTNTSAPNDDEPILSGLAASPGWTGSLMPLQVSPWFPVVQLIPAAAFLGLWSWDRRRRYFEQHPDVLLRRRARRALRRERRALRRAARARDASRFANAAVSAMRVACAPHYPAEPRALVGSDVLGVLGANGESAVVRQLFAISDASLFAATPTDASSLLALQPKLETVLDQLESKL
jgi:hypothetical protein